MRDARCSVDIARRQVVFGAMLLPLRAVLDFQSPVALLRFRLGLKEDSIVVPLKNQRVSVEHNENILASRPNYDPI